VGWEIVLGFTVKFGTENFFVYILTVPCTRQWVINYSKWGMVMVMITTFDLLHLVAGNNSCFYPTTSYQLLYL